MAAPIYISIKKDNQNNYNLAELSRQLGISITISDQNTLVITKIPGLNKVAKTKHYIIDTDFNVELQDLYVDSLKVYCARP